MTETNTKKKSKLWSVLYQNDCGEKDATVKELSDKLDISEICAKLLINRGYTNVEDAESFLKNETSVLHDPFILADIRPAIERIRNAVENGENIVIYGDYDVDGVTAVSTPAVLKVYLPVQMWMRLFFQKLHTPKQYCMVKALRIPM